MTATDKDDGPYPVGRGKPPQKTQFKKGQSGNPKGHPKGSKNFKSTINTELNRKVAVNEEGRRKRITKREAIAKQLVDKAAAGDPKAIPVLMREVFRKRAIPAATPGSRGFPMSPDDNLVLENIIKRIRESNTPRPLASSEAAASPTTPSSQQTNGTERPENTQAETNDADEPS